MSDKISGDFSTMSQSLLEQIWVAHEEKKANKWARHELNLWHTKEKVRQHTSQHEHELLLLQEHQEHEKDMKDKDIASMQLQPQTEKLKHHRTVKAWTDCKADKVAKFAHVCCRQ